ncbi:MAG TPA: cytidylate kinase-like family protein [Candidatus Fusicatenibacter merdavium]|uniref:Cytidylate kinase-like family protein n=1 Tax=Candidatus Fusicatenibacter merdavium TaxID=2838600 RepID=A0A9D2BJ39_9FIRM|nr:cytidylate kinase-like family protein [Candidatus Fusicatenibacter merdavium]
MIMGVITIGRLYGSDGRKIAQELANRLGFRFYDKELIRLAAKESNIPYDDLVKADEKRASFWAYPTDNERITEDRWYYSVNDILYDTEKKIIREKAEKEDCVIVGRCANRILSDRKDCLSVFVYAPMDYRIRTVMEREYLSEKEARARIRKMDKQRRYHYNYFTDRNWEDMDEYDICIDSSKCSIERCAKVLEGVYHTLKEG